MKTIKVISILLVTALVACKKDGPVPVDLGYDYFPTQTGHYVDYQVDSVFIDDQSGLAQAVDTSYFLRELIADEFIDQSGRTVQRLERFVNDSAVGQWQLKDVWTIHRTTQYAEKVEENHRKLRLAFRPDLNKTWDLNAFNGDSAFVPNLGAGNAIDEVELNYTAVDVPYFINGFAFDSTVVVEATYPSNLIVTLEETERYAKGVGLIEKKWIEKDTQLDLFGNWQTTGFELTYTLIGYGQL